MDKLILSEKQILTTIRLSGVQKAILTKIVAAATPEVAYEQISDGRNFVAARDMLKKLGLLDFEEGTASLTDTGTQVMKDENLMDESGALTQDGQQYVEADNPNEITNKKMGTADADASTQPPEGGGEAEDDLGLGGADDDLGLGDEEGKDKEGDEPNPFESSLIQSINKASHTLTED